MKTDTSHGLEQELTQASLSELESTLRALRSIKIAQKRAGKKGIQSVVQKNTDLVRIEIPVGTDHSLATEFAKKVTKKDVSAMAVIENNRLTAGIRVFDGDSLYDGAFGNIVQKI